MAICVGSPDEPCGPPGTGMNMKEHVLESGSEDHAQARTETDPIDGGEGAAREISTAAGAATRDTHGASGVPTNRPAAAEPATSGPSVPEPSVMVGIPAYNEAGSIADVVNAASTHAAVVVVDDGSDDETGDRARAAGATVVTHDDNQGYGATLGTIFSHAYTAGVDHLVILDGDGQHDPGDIPKIVDAQRSSDVDIVVGSRFVDGSDTHLPPYRRVGLAVVNALTNAGMRLRYSTTTVADTQSGFRAYDRDAIETLARTDDIGTGMGASLDILFRAAREGLEVAEVPTTVTYDVAEASTQNPATHGLTLLHAIARETVPPRAVRMTAGVGVVALTLVAVVGMVGHVGVTATHAIAALLVGGATAMGIAYPSVILAVLGLAGR